MEPLIIVALIASGFIASMMGSLFGVGGGTIMVPILAIGFNLSLHETAAISLVGIVASASASAAFYAENKVANVRLAIFLEIGTCVGAVSGALISAYVSEWLLMIVFSLFLVVSFLRMFITRKEGHGSKGGEHEYWYKDLKTGEMMGYDVKHPYAGCTVCVAAGAYSSLTGVGGSVIKIPLMNEVMGVPSKAASATTSYTSGITAFVGASMYFITGAILLDYAAFVAIGSFLGASIGAKSSKFFKASDLKMYTSFIILLAAISMLLRAGGIL